MPITLVQELDQIALTGGHSEIVLTVPPGGVAEGHSIVVAVALDTNQVGAVTASDTAGNLYTVDRSVISPDFVQLRTVVLSAHAVLPLPSGGVISIDLPVEVTHSAAVAVEYAGLAAIDTVDQRSGAQGHSTAATTGATPATEQAEELAFAAFGVSGTPAEGLTPAAGWTELSWAQGAVVRIYPVHQVLSVAGAVEATGTFDTTVTYAAALVTYRAGEPAGETQTMADPVGNLGHVAIGIEATAGTGVDAQVYLDAISEAIKGEGGPIRSKALTGGRMVKKAVMGPYNWRGEIQYEVTPDKCTKLLYAALGSLTAATETAAPYTHVFKTGSSLKPLTVHVYRPGPDGATEPCYFVYPGGYVESLEFSQNAEEILVATASLQGRGGEVVYNAAQADGGLAYSAEDPFVFHELAVSLGGNAVAITNDWRFRINTGLIVRRNLSAGRAANRAFAGDSLISGSFVLVFEDITEHRKWMGATADTSPVGVGTTVATQALQLVWTKTSSLKLTLKCGSAYYKASGPAIQGRDQVILQPIEWEALYNGSDLSDLVATVVNGETSSVITQAAATISP